MVEICGLLINILLRNGWMHLSINFCGYAFFDKSLSTSRWNFKKKEAKLKQRFDKEWSKSNLYSSGIKLMKLVYIPLSHYYYAYFCFLRVFLFFYYACFFFNLLFSSNIIASRKEMTSLLQSQLKISCCCVFQLYLREKNCRFSGLLNKIKISSTYFL